MQSRFRRIALTMVSVSVGGYLAGTGGCLSFAGERLLETIDFCFIIDCTDGAGGLLQPCISRQNDQQNEGLLFQDCPDQNQGP